MSRRIASLLVGLSLSACAGGAAGQRVQVVTARHVVQGAEVSQAGWLHGAPMHQRVMVGADGETYVGLWIDTPRAATAVARAPLDVALVVDTSGSMSGDKIQNARLAAASFIDGLAEGDIVSLYAFSDAPRMLAAPTVVDRDSRARLLAQVGGLYAAGGTNLYGGLSVGQDAVASAPPTHPVRRVVLISDGRANIGPSSTAELGDLAARVTENGAQVTAIGVGLDYDEGTLGAIAARTAGRLYHLEQPQQMAVILHDELDLLGQTVATNAVIEFVPEPGVTLEPVGVTRVDREGLGYRLPLGSLYGAQHREVLFRVRAPMQARGLRNLGSARLRFDDPVARAPRDSGAVAIQVEAAEDVRGAPVNERVASMVTRYEVAQAQLRAAQAMNAGRAAEADAHLARAEETLQRAQVQFHDEAVQGELRRQAGAVTRNRVSTQRIMRAPAAAPSAARGAALQMNADSMHDLGL